MSKKFTLAVAALAAQLAKEDKGLYMTAKQIAADALKIHLAATAARKAIESKKPPGPAVAKVKDLADAYKADVVFPADVRGMVLGLRFRSGRFSSGTDNVFYVS